MNRIAANLLLGKTVYITTDSEGNLKPAAKVYGGTPTATVTEIQPAGKGLLIVTNQGSFEVATSKKTLFVADEDETTETTEISDKQEADNEARMTEADAAAANAEAAIIAEKEAELAEAPEVETPTEPAEKPQDAPTPKATKESTPAAPRQSLIERKMARKPMAPTADMHPLVQHLLTRRAELHELDLVSGPDRQRFRIKNLQVETDALLTAAKLALTEEQLAPLGG